MENQLMMALGLNTSAFKHGMKEAQHLTTELGEKFKETGLELASALGLGLAAFKGFELIKEGVDEFKKINIQSALLTNELKNQGKYSKELVDNLKEGRELLSSLGYYKETDQLAFQREMQRNFPNANNAYREEYTTNAANIAASRGISLDEAQQQENKIIALRPTRNGSELPQLRQMLSEFGVDFWEKNKNAIMAAASHGQNAYVNFMTKLLGEAPALKNAAKTAAENDPDLKYNKAMEEFTVHLGELGTKIKKAFLPDMERAIQWLDDLVTNHFDQIKDTVISIGHGLEFVAKHIEALGIAFAAKKLIDGLSWITEIFAKVAGKEALTATALMNVTAEVVNINGAIGGAAAGGVGGAEAAASGGAIATLSRTGFWTTGVLAALSLFFNKGDNSHNNNEAAEYYSANGVKIYNPHGANRQELVKQGLLQKETAEELNERLHPQMMKINDENKFKKFVGDEFTKVGDLLGLNKILQTISKNTKKGDSGTKTANANVLNSTDGTTVKGSQTKQIIINIHDGLIKSMVNNFSSLKESAEEIERVVTQAILNGIQAGEMLSK